jgi:methionyl-tRNA synthetase
MLGKDILRFHCVIWPALLLSAGYEVPQQLFVHGFLLLDDRKISKSVGSVIDPLELIDLYGADPIRFWCARAVSFGQDGNASVGDVHERYERELGNELGNLLSRTTAMIARYRGGRLRHASDVPPPASLDALAQDVAERIDRFDITGAAESIWVVVRRLNQYVEEQAPWRLAKEQGSEERLDDVLYHLADGLRGVAIALSSYLPETAPLILEALGQPSALEWELVRNGAAEEVEGIEPAAPLFPRVEAPSAAA